MKKENIIKILIPIIAVVVVIESVVLVSNLNQSTSDVVVEREDIVPTEEVTEPVADFIFETDSKEMVVGKSYEVSLNLVGKQDVNLDAMEVYFNYEPEKLTLSKLTANKDFPDITSNSGIDSETGLVSSVFLWGIDEVGSVKTDEVSNVLTFTVTPEVAGEAEITLITGNTDEESVTMMVENSSSKALPFLGNKLEINVTE